MRGKGVSPGIGFGKALIIKNEKIKISKEKVKDSKNELENFYKNLNELINDIEKDVNNLTGTEQEIMSAYLMIVQDKTLIEDTINLIQNENYNAVYATEIGLNMVIEKIKSIEDEYISQRATDIEDIKNRLLKKLLNIKNINLSNLAQKCIVVGKELTISEITKLDLKNVEGIVTEAGGANSHVSIMAKTRGIPVIVGVKNLLEEIKDNVEIIIDGESGEIYVNPSKDIEEKFKLKKANFEKQKLELENYKNLETMTLDGYKIKLFANIGNPSEIEIVKEKTAEGIGLFRSEFLYMDSDKMPDEEMQFEAYKEVAKKMNNQEVIIRTLDIGGDKKLKYFNLDVEENPFLGYRAIRICLDRVDIFKIQLRAILKASAFGNISIMFPMISSIEELRNAKEILEEVKEELREKNIEFKENIKVGIMIEIPATAILAEEFAKECDFFSIGTNDLIQYATAVERGNEKIAKLYSKNHPAVIRLIKMAIDGAHKENILCGMCGEAASDSAYIKLLIGLGIDELSMNPNKILNARKIIRTIKKSECEEFASKALQLSSSDDVENFLKSN
jgi:phosphotransferase system enzyme I (PtsI)